MKRTILILMTAAALVACKKDKEDSTKPVINAVKVNGAVAEEHDVDAGSTLVLEITTSDNNALNQLKVNIHGADDGHTHGGGPGESVEPNVGTWSETRIFDLDGKSDVRTVSFEVPTTIAGHWHVEVALIDDDGNEADEYVTTLHVENSYFPVITFSTTPAAVDGEITMAVNESVLLDGSVSDPDGLASIHFELESEAGAVIWEYEAPSVSGTSMDFIAQPAGPITEAGEYHLHVHATDNAGYTAEWEVHVGVE